MPSRGAAQDDGRRLLAFSCAGCHGPEGRTPGIIPALAGRSADSIAVALRAFKEERQPATIMNRIAKGFSDAEIDALSREIAASWK